MITLEYFRHLQMNSRSCCTFLLKGHSALLLSWAVAIDASVWSRCRFIPVPFPVPVHFFQRSFCATARCARLHWDSVRAVCRHRGQQWPHRHRNLYKWIDIFFTICKMKKSECVVRQRVLRPLWRARTWPKLWASGLDGSTLTMCADRSLRCFFLSQKTTKSCFFDPS